MKVKRVVTTLKVMVVTLLAVEVLSRLLLFGIVHWRVDPRVSADGYHDAPWVQDLYEESLASGYVDWQSYVYWRRRPFVGDYINVDDQGVRKTWRAAGTPVRTLFVMGGSTVWGTGARDDFTIPSYLAKQLQERGHSVSVINYGETGYVVDQDVLFLLGRLRRGERPNVVVFYTGVNDVFAALQNRRPGLPQNENNRRMEFNLLQPESGAKLLMALTSGTQRVAALGDQVVAHYCETARMVVGLGQQYGFRALFYWQPVIFGKDTRTAYEEAAYSRYAYTREFFDQVYGRIAAGPPPCAGLGVRDLSEVFSHDERPYYVDEVHLTEEGNERVAAAMLPSLLETLSAP